MKSILNIASFSLDRDNFRVLLQKLWRRLQKKNKSVSQLENLKWLEDSAISADEFCKIIDSKMWAEAKARYSVVKRKAEKQSKKLSFSLGGGGAVDVLYFLARKTKPKVILETGVGAGHSSLAFLTAIDDNCIGVLFSSDLPYFRLENPEQYVGFVVPKNLRKNWRLHLKGDSLNLSKILPEIETIDLFHYDSDKSFTGRANVLKMLHGKIATATIVIDDIQDNDHFYNLAMSDLFKGKSVFVIREKNKYVGILI